MGKEELIRYFEDAIALETEIVTQENLVSQFEAMSEKKKPVLVERKIQEKRPDADEFDKETNAVVGSIIVWTILWLMGVISVRDAGIFWVIICLIIMAIGDAIPLFIYLPEKNEIYPELVRKYEEDCKACWEENKKRRACS